jgi:hypothetical protein
MAATSAAVTAGVATSKASASLLGGAKVSLLAQFGIATVAGATLASSAMLVPAYVPPIRALWSSPAASTQAPTRVVRSHAARSRFDEPEKISGAARDYGLEHALDALAPGAPESVNGMPASAPSQTWQATSEPAAESTKGLPVGELSQQPKVDAVAPRAVTVHSTAKSVGVARVAAAKLGERIATSASAAPTARTEVAPATSSPAEVARTAPARAPRVQLLEEGRALALVQRALSEHRGGEALLLLDQQNESYPTGALAPERAAAKVIALCEVGRRVEARSAAERFAQAWPESPLVGRVLETCKPR